jgi:hypothetical protein
MGTGLARFEHAFTFLSRPIKKPAVAGGLLGIDECSYAFGVFGPLSGSLGLAM